MAYSTGPSYNFKDKTSTGIDKVPVGRIVLVEDYDGKFRAFIKQTDVGMTSLTTVEQARDKLEVFNTGINTSGLDALTETVATDDLHRILDTRLL